MRHPCLISRNSTDIGSTESRSSLFGAGEIILTDGRQICMRKRIEQKHRSQRSPLHSSPNISHSDYRQYYSSIPKTTPSLGDAFI